MESKKGQISNEDTWENKVFDLINEGKHIVVTLKLANPELRKWSIGEH